MSKLSSENVNMMSSFAMTKKGSYFEINNNRNNSIVFKVLHIKLHLSPFPTDDNNYAYTILLLNVFFSLGYYIITIPSHMWCLIKVSI
jgi:hypothetical protein